MTPAGSREFEYRLRFSRRASRIRISVLPGRVSVTAPCGIPEGDVDCFVRSRSSWIMEKLTLFEKHPGPSAEVKAVPGEMIWLFGEKLSIIRESHRSSFSAANGEFHLGDEWLREKELRNLLDDLLMERIRRTTGEFSKATGLSPSGVRLGNARTRWGSCSPSDRIMINRRLVHAPLTVVDYIVLHELMHLRHRNHSAQFWNDLNSLFSGTAQARKWLRFQGAHLL
jgi:predicted metal-dependent hydrolase